MAEVAFIVFMLVFGLLVMILLISRARMAELRLQSELDSGAQMLALEKIVADNQAEMAQLKARLVVLERLATDEDQRVAREIDRLKRDQGPEARS